MIEWTNPQPNVIYVQSDNKLKLSVFTLDKSKLGAHTVTLKNTLTYGGVTWTPTYSFAITVVDPCSTTTLLTQSITTLTTNNGVKGSVTFPEVLDSYGNGKGQNGLCGPRAYAIKYTNDNVISWVTVAATTNKDADGRVLWEIKADPTLDAHATTHNLKLIVTLTLYSSIAAFNIPFNVNVVTPPCECSRIVWDAPALQTLTTTVKKTPADTLTISHGTVNAASLLATPQIRACQGTCSTTTSIKSIVDSETNALPAFMTLTSGVLKVDAQSNDVVKTYNMKVTMATPASGDQVFSTVKVVLGNCVITRLDPPTAPTATAYSLFATSDLTIDLSTPGFLQFPACGYYLVETFKWTIPAGAPITEDTTSKYKIKVSSRDPLKHGDYTVGLQLSALYATLTQTHVKDITFTVSVTDPCRTTVFTAFTLTTMTFQAGQSTTQDFN